MKEIIKNKLKESLTFDIIENMIGEDYPSSFDMDHFKTLDSFAARKRYCEEHLQRISSGSSRIVYKVDDEKVLKLAYNKKGVAQNDIEIDYGQYYDLEGVVAKIFDFHPNKLWVEMELARKVTKLNFASAQGYSFDDFAAMVNNYGVDSGNSKGYKVPISPEIEERLWEDEFSYGILNFIGNYGVPVGDLKRTSSYGFVNRNGGDIVLIDYGLTHDVYDSYYR
jgi:hypothetical protein